jgi:predicted transcriptional regulator
MTQAEEDSLRQAMAESTPYKKSTPADLAHAAKALKEKGLSVKEIAGLMGKSQTTIYRYLKM